MAYRYDCYYNHYDNVAICSDGCTTISLFTYEIRMYFEAYLFVPMSIIELNSTRLSWIFRELLYLAISWIQSTSMNETVMSLCLSLSPYLRVCLPKATQIDKYTHTPQRARLHGLDRVGEWTREYMLVRVLSTNIYAIVCTWYTIEMINMLLKLIFAR